MEGTLYAALFYLISATAILSAGFMVYAKDLVRTAIALFVTMVSIAGLFTILNAEFLAAVQILIYAGAVTVLILFVIMITAKKIDKQPSWFNAQADISLWVISILLVGIIVALLKAQWPTAQKVVEKSTGPLAQVLFNEYWLPFEVASLILLVALVGAIVLARRDEND